MGRIWKVATLYSLDYTLLERSRCSTDGDDCDDSAMIATVEWSGPGLNSKEIGRGGRLGTISK